MYRIKVCLVLCFICCIVSAQDNVDSYWGEWQEWSECSNDCGVGIRERLRPCEGAGECDYTCDGCEDFQQEDCLNEQPCPEWSPWEAVDDCNATCGWGNQTMRRTCDDVGCIGEAEKIEACWVECKSCDNEMSETDCETYKVWCQISPTLMTRYCPKTCSMCDRTCSCQTKWSSWTPCTLTCGGGVKYRQRDCSNVEDRCGLSSNMEVPCNTQECRNWSSCSRTCGWGTRHRRRVCPPNNPLICIKTQMEYEDCKNMDCPPKSCPRGSFPRYGTNTKCCTPDNENCGSFFGNDNDIVGGVAADKRSWPWMLRLRLGNPRGGSFASCGASLIHSRWAITATHCILTFTGPRQILAIASQTRYVHKVYKHEGFSSWLENDISLLEFKEPFEFNPETNIAPVCLPWNEETPDDTQCFAAGWGATDPADLRPSNTLQQVRLRNLNMDVCRYAYDQAPGDPFRIPNADKLNETTMICAGRLRGGADTCAGDSGGPLMCQRCSTCSWYIAGITSYGTANCGASGRPGVYTKVLAYEPWIRETTRGEIQRIRDFRGSCSIQNTLQ